MLPLALAFLLASGGPCSLRVEPLVGQTPFRYLRLTTHFDNPAHWRLAVLTLVDADDEVTSTQLFADDAAQYEPKTRITEWKNLDLAPGAYEVRLVAVSLSDRCTARQPIEVQ